MDPRPTPPERRIYCNRTLNLRSIRAIGYDMDYTLIHYHVEEWERRAYEHIRDRLAQEGWPVAGLRFDPTTVTRGLVIDTELGNVIKANRFGFVKRASHGTRVMDYDEQRHAYSRTIVDLAEDRWAFLNTLFNLSEGCMYAQLVDLLDKRMLPGTLGYADLYEKVRSTLDAAHMEGRLKAEILENPERFVVLDAETPLALLDQRRAGKKLLLITNSDWEYTSPIMTYAFDRFLPDGMTWRELFDVVIVSARKPDFFTAKGPLFEVATEEGLLRRAPFGLREGAAFLGGSARHVEEHLGLSGDEILYVGDHMFGDVHVTKSVLRWRTALILRELETELSAIFSFRPDERELEDLMEEKTRLEDELSDTRLALQRAEAGYGPKPAVSPSQLRERFERLREEITALDARIAPLAKASAELGNPGWGLLLRAGNDKSHLARQVERYADIYTSRVSNFLFATPFTVLRSPRGSMPHDPAGD
ncbi:HAD-IG family 5'-nucleotidase [Vulgatibacter incomptus]|uniref:HAD superfamily (Subfamily IG) hydrolase, 5'-nucleotidase n=1 Tax=Vulgatibacter incomptus TaxID=1391653 RepID=A0A0K1PFT9_9BACT|nr:HAD-IG family 5'-nucleotidase [Vulgatibacter incomptus]AKU92372.1 HAD superfamily (Subfamily IG) hydrolase, 5'-nucleotidase [Vulgatibacter incomptus]